MKAASVKKFGVGTFDALNSGRVPTGGLKDWVSDRIEGAKEMGSKLVDLVKDGPKVAIKYLFDSALKPLIDNLGTGFVPQLVGGILRKLASYVTNWGDNEQEKQDKERAAEAGGTIPPYTGKPGGWTYPLAKKFRSYTFAGHNPAHAYDIGAPAGIGVRAVSAGRVITSIDKGATSYGQYLRISHADGTTSLYAHLSKRMVGAGDIVKTGQLIGISGYSGGVRPTGPRGAHLHFELGGYDAREMMRRRGVMLARGGTVMATPGGVLALLAEGGRHERVEPLNSSGLSRRDMALINAVAMRVAQTTESRGGEQGVTVKVYIGDEELRDIVQYEIQDNQTGLTRDLAIGRRR
jgi:murein DD-endopeptidase MepM/ murein hydrolase activator NlpD